MSENFIALRRQQPKPTPAPPKRAVSESAVFVLVYNDVFGNLGSYGTRAYEKGKSPEAPEPAPEPVAVAAPSLREALGITEDQFHALRFSAAHDGIFERHATQLWSFLTSHAVATILESAKIRTLAIGEQALVDGVASLGDVRLEDIVAVGISTTFTFDSGSLGLLVNRARELAPGAPIVIGGAGITLNNHWFGEVDADYMVNGDAEAALPLLVSKLAAKDASFLDVPNLHWKTPDGTIAKTERDYDAVPMDEVPTPKWSLLNQEAAWPRAIWYESLRGCPFRCKFCSYPQQSPKWRTKSAERMVEEFFYYSNQGVEVINCFDSTMLTPPKRMREFCEIMIAKGPPVRWACWGHPGQLQDPSLLHLMAKAGCRTMSIGVESGDEQILLNMNKHITTARALQAVENVKAAGILCIANFFVGFPGETDETAANTLDFIRRARPDFYAIQPFQVRDRTIPILEEADQYELQIEWGEYGKVDGWSHATMNSQRAQEIVQSHLSHAIENFQDSINWNLVRIQGGVIVLGLRLKDADEVREFRRVIKPMLKRYEQVLLRHPGGKYGSGDKDAVEAEARMAELRAELAAHVASGVLKIDPPAHLSHAITTGDLSRFAPAMGSYSPPPPNEDLMP